MKGADLGPVPFLDPGALETHCQYLNIWISLGPSGLIRSATVSAVLTSSLFVCLVLVWFLLRFFNVVVVGVCVF